MALGAFEIYIECSLVILSNQNAIMLWAVPKVEIIPINNGNSFLKLLSHKSAYTGSIYEKILTTQNIDWMALAVLLLPGCF
jgi:hypothetical protein